MCASLCCVSVCVCVLGGEVLCRSTDAARTQGSSPSDLSMYSYPGHPNTRMLFGVAPRFGSLCLSVCPFHGCRDSLQTVARPRGCGTRNYIQDLSPSVRAAAAAPARQTENLYCVRTSTLFEPVPELALRCGASRALAAPASRHHPWRIPPATVTEGQGRRRPHRQGITFVPTPS